MPYQSRGFWCCDFCKLKLDSFEDAKHHELEECQQNQNKPQQQQPQQAPLQLQHPQVHRFPTAGIYHQQQRPPPHLPGYYRPPGTMAPVSNALNVLPKQEGRFFYSNRKSFALMGLMETSQMNKDDSVACQSLEIFEAGQSETSDVDLRAQYPSLTIGQMGLRCIHCSSSPKSIKEATYFPFSITGTDSLADGVRVLSQRHLGKCSMAPVSVRDINQQAAEKRSKNAQERGSSWHDDERSLSALRDWCYRFCQRLGIVDKGSDGTGLLFINHTREIQQTGLLGRPRPGPMGHLGAEPLAPTPVARRRDRPAMPREGGEYHSIGVYEASQGNEAYYGAQDAVAMHAPGGPESQPAGVSPHRDYEQQQQMIAPLEIPGNFPYFQEANGSWTCKYCSHVPPPYRDPQAGWSAPNHIPPPPQYMDKHLSMCRAYHQSTPAQAIFQGGPHPQFQFTTQQFPGGFVTAQQHQGWEGQGPGSQGNQCHQYPYPQSSQETFSCAQRHIPPRGSYPHTPHQLSGPAKYGETSRRGVVLQSRTPINTNTTQRPDTADTAVRHAIDYLAALDQDATFTPGGLGVEFDQLVLEEDRLLLTDYFFYLMKQLRLCRFSESDRKTRGGKREKILIGFGGLQCIHCSEANNSRKFFWSNVDRLANSFAEIPGHVLKCRHCPQQTKDALFQLKQLHPEQMARLPRGSQKVFFRRMWRRLHDEDPAARSPEQATPPQPSSGSGQSVDIKSPGNSRKSSVNDTSPGGTLGSEESTMLMQRSTKEAARALADSVSMSLPPSPNSRVLLAIPEDKEWLSDTDCFIRRQIEVFCASINDVNVARSDRKFPVHEGQVGIRCVHCSFTKQGPSARGSAVAYPFSVSGIYESVREFQRLHLDSCEHLPDDMKSKLTDLKGSTSLSSVLRKYYVLAAKALGLKDTRDGIRAGADSVPIGSQAAFAFSEGGPAMSDELRRSTVPSTFPEVPTPALTPVESRKKKQQMETDSPEKLRSFKRSHTG